MVNASFLKDKILNLFLLVIVSLLLYPLEVKSAVFNVTNEDELRDALSMAESNGEDDVINIAAGVYQTFGAPFEYSSAQDFALTIEGAGAGFTILDGGETNRVLEINTVSEADIVITIKSLTIQNGYHLSMLEDGYIPGGAGINAFSQNVSIENCEFINNFVSTTGNGGGLFADVENKINLLGNLFSGNSAPSDGGGANLNAFELYISGNQFIDNSAVLGSGGGAYTSGIKLYLNDNEFYGNLSGDNSGGLYSRFFSSQEVANVNMINNIFAQNNSFMSGNREGGAVSILGAEEVNIINNTLTMNSSGEESGALMLEIPVPFPGDNIINIYNNIAIANDIIDGADILVNGQPFPVPTIPPTGFPEPVTVDYGTVNLFNNDVGVFEVKEPISGGCDISEVTCVLEINEGDNISEDPLLVNAEVGDFSLLPDSPCIDAGDPDAPDVPDTDIFGNPRVPPPDMGAVEFIEEVVKGGGGCSITSTPVTSSLAVFFVLPVLLIIRRIVKEYRRY